MPSPIKTRDARLLSMDEARRLVNLANNQHGSLSDPESPQRMDLQGWLDLYWETYDAIPGGWDGFSGMLEEDRASALLAWERVQLGVQKRHRAEVKRARAKVG